MDKIIIEEKIAKGHLIPFNRRPKEEARLINQKGGKSKSIKKSEGAKLRFIKERLKKGSFTDEDQKWILEQIENRTSAAANIIIEINKLKDNIHPSQRVALLNTEISAYKFLHGDKVVSSNTNFNINMDIVEWEKRLMGDNDGDDSNV